MTAIVRGVVGILLLSSESYSIYRIRFAILHSRCAASNLLILHIPKAVIRRRSRVLNLLAPPPTTHHDLNPI